LRRNHFLHPERTTGHFRPPCICSIGQQGRGVFPFLLLGEEKMRAFLPQATVFPSLDSHAGRDRPEFQDEIGRATADAAQDFVFPAVNPANGFIPISQIAGNRVGVALPCRARRGASLSHPRYRRSHFLERSNRHEDH
jgi:hypothetical protein